MTFNFDATQTNCDVGKSVHIYLDVCIYMCVFVWEHSSEFFILERWPFVWVENHHKRSKCRQKFEPLNLISQKVEPFHLFTFCFNVLHLTSILWLLWLIRGTINGSIFELKKTTTKALDKLCPFLCFQTGKKNYVWYSCKWSLLKLIN